MIKTTQSPFIESKSKASLIKQQKRSYLKDINAISCTNIIFISDHLICDISVKE